MKIIRFENPQLSFNPKILFIEKQDEVKYKIFADGFEVGLILERNGYWFVNHDNVALTDKDKGFLIEGASKL